MCSLQLWEDIDAFDARANPLECHFHRFGEFGVLFVDSRGCRTFGFTPGDPRPYLSSKQMAAIEAVLSDAARPGAAAAADAKAKVSA